MSKQPVTDADRSIGRRIQVRRKELGITAAELSERLGISQQQLSRYERGTNKVNVSHLVNIAVYLDIPIGWFFLDCVADLSPVISEQNARYVTPLDAELKKRLNQRWERLSLEQRRTLIGFLDSLVLPSEP
ncbi:MAG: helix-turn-helix transcriptional regulator [Porticoccaceae bacterium]|nr:helix-turn-helix transcriptional regulator [Porticoccaceae bacterium]